MSERSETERLFMKLTEPADIWRAALREEDDWYVPVLDAWDVSRLDADDLEYLIRKPDDPRNEKAWVYREALRSMRLWSRPEMGDFPLGQLISYCRRLENGSFFRWCVAPSYADVTKIRYTPNETYGKGDRQVVTTLGKFLTKHYSELGAETIRAFQNKWVELTKPVELFFAETPDEVEGVYRNGPPSCMSHNMDEYRSCEHPSRLWGYCKHTRVAYSMLGDKINVRALVRDDRKEWIRIYPAMQSNFEKALRDAGFKPGTLEGLRVPAIGSGDGYLMPYTDGVGYGRLQGSEIVLGSRGDFETQITSGVCSIGGDDEGWQCPHCEHWHDNDDDARSTHAGDLFCGRCEDDFVTALSNRRREIVVHVDDATYIDCLNEWVVNGAEEENGAVWLDDEDDYVRRDEVVQLDDGDYVRREDACETEDCDYVRKEDAVKLDDGAWVRLTEVVMKPDGSFVRREEEEDGAQLPAPADVNAAPELNLDPTYTDPDPSVDKVRRVVIAFDSGYDVASIARAQYFRPDQVRAILTTYGRREWTVLDIEHLKAGHRSGHTVEQLAAALSRDPRDVRARLKRCGCVPIEQAKGTDEGYALAA